MKKIVLSAVVGCLLFFWGSVESEAQFNFGVKSLTFHNSINPMDQSLGSYFGANVGENVVLLGGFDYGRLGLSVEVSAGGLTVKEDMSFSYIMPHGGVKFYLRPREEGQVSPYILGELFKSFGGVDLGGLGEELDLEEAEDIIKDVLSPFGMVAGFGSEYYFSDNFGIGGEVGLRLVFTSTEVGEGEGKVEVSVNRYSMYGGFTFNFNL